MNDRDQKMMTEIGKVIMNILDSEGGVTLPSIGVIKRVDESYELAEDGEYTSLVDALESMSGVSRRQAEALYGCWLDVAQVEDGVYTIDMIGTVKGGELIVEHKLFSKLNTKEARSISEVMEEVAAEEAIPEPEQPKVVESKPTPKPTPKKDKKSGGNPLPYVIAAVVLVGVAIYGFFAVGNMEKEEVETVAIAEQIEQVAEAAEAVEPEPVVVKKQEPKPVVGELYLEKGEQPRLRTYRGRTISDDDALAVLEQAIERSSDVASNRFQVVLGVYSYGSNIGRLIVDFDKFLGDRAVPTYVVEYGKSRVVSLFGSDSMAECEQFVSQIGGKLTGNLWICRVK